MQVVLLQNISGIGRKGDVKNVKEGYFKNFLQPKKLAIIATEGKVKEAEHKRKTEVVQQERLLEEAKEVCAKLNGLKITIKGKSKGDKLYGSIGEKEIVDAVLERTKIKLEKEYISLSEHIKVVGSYEIPVHISEGASAKIHLDVKSE